MNKLNIIIKNKISNLRCLEHNSSTTVKINGDKINFDCCCDSFKKKAEEVITKTTKEFIQSELKNAFNGRYVMS